MIDIVNIVVNSIIYFNWHRFISNLSPTSIVNSIIIPAPCTIKIVI
jgi:hypothetical protein